jgi:hypothetical protein
MGYLVQKGKPCRSGPNIPYTMAQSTAPLALQQADQREDRFVSPTTLLLNNSGDRLYRMRNSGVKIGRYGGLFSSCKCWRASSPAAGHADRAHHPESD